MLFTVRILGALSLSVFCARAESLVTPLTPQQAADAKRVIASFKANPRGPFQRIRWYCADGSVLPPAGVPCKDLGGGVQHAELGPDAIRLAAWKLNTGTILTGMPYDALLDAGLDNHRLKELVLEKYLVEIDNGWIYRGAVSYRGARQVEDEEKAGREFLIRLLSDPAWLSRRYFLAQQLLDVVPHGLQDNAVKRIRTLAVVAATGDARFQPIRAKIHSYPAASDAALVRAFIKDKSPAPTVKTVMEELATLIDQRRNDDGLGSRLRAVRRVANPATVAALDQMAGTATLSQLSILSLAIRAQVVGSTNGRANLQLLDLNAALQEKAFELAGTEAVGSRAGRLEDLRYFIGLATGAGLLSPRQRAALESEIASLGNQAPLPADAYRAAIRYLGRASEWSRATVSKEFGPLVTHYKEAEPLAGGLVDHLLRSSIALQLTSRLDPLLSDADRVTGIRHAVFGQSPAGVVGLNPGVASGILRILAEGAEPKVDPRGIYVIPQTVADLKPVAGILTLDSGNALSHTQLLAANLGIPNAVIPSRLLATLKQHEGKEVFFAVTPRNVVIFKDKADLTASERAIWATQPASSLPRIELDTSALNLTERRLRRLSELSSKDSGVIVGPKAANLGQLRSYFPDKVAQGFVVPFGIFVDHISRALDSTGVPLIRQIETALVEAENMRDRGAEPAAVSAFINPKLEQFRKTIQTMPLLPQFERDVIAALGEQLGPDGSFGAFVRSDTNAEDLPQFTGAGLNLTVPNVVGSKNILQALRNVWASPYSERAWEWRARALKHTGKVYPSVIIMRAVNNDKSGVIATADLETGAQDRITINASEGVSAVVDGGVAESLLLNPDNSVRLLQQCRATYRKVCRRDGGFDLLPALGDDTVLQPAELDQLRKMVAEVKSKYPAAKTANGMVLPWDIEFGFEKGELRLFQIRPLARFQEVAMLSALSGLEHNMSATAVVRLEDQPLQ
jgi:hypothetical protein